jgi:hypothetical protein
MHRCGHGVEFLDTDIFNLSAEQCVAFLTAMNPGTSTRQRSGKSSEPQSGPYRGGPSSSVESNRHQEDRGSGIPHNLCWAAMTEEEIDF